jgi:hypothetical protein
MSSVADTTESEQKINNESDEVFFSQTLYMHFYG